MVISKKTKVLDKAQLEELQGRVGQIESVADIELVLVIAKRSVSVGHMNVFVSALILMMVSVAMYVFDPFLIQIHSQYHVLFIILSVFLGYLLSQVDGVQRILTSDKDEIEAVGLMAELEYFRLKVGKTPHQNGILLYISVMERRAVILAGQKISMAMGQDQLQTLVTELTQNIAQKGFMKALHKILDRIRECMTERFPLSGPKFKNDLSDSVVLRRFQDE